MAGAPSRKLTVWFAAVASAPADLLVWGASPSQAFHFMKSDDGRELEHLATTVVDDAVGENLDQLAILDMRGDGIVRVLYRAARELQGEPLCLRAARILLDSGGKGERVLLLTGFLSPKPYPETDGLIGSAVLAAALERACGTIPVFVCEPEVLPPLAAGLRGAGLNVAPDIDSAAAVPHPAVIVSFESGRDDAAETCEGLARMISPSVCVAVERPGANSEGQYHFAMG